MKSAALLFILSSLPVPAMQIFVKDREGITINLEVEGNDSIQDVKSKFQVETGADPSVTRLFFNGLLLEDGNTLADYSIQKESNLDSGSPFALIRLNGGGSLFGGERRELLVSGSTGLSDTILYSGPLTVVATPENPFIIILTGGADETFDVSVARTFTLFDSQDSVGTFTPDQFSINTSGLNFNGTPGKFEIVEGSIAMTYTPVPEPSALAVMGVAVVGMIFLRRRV